MKLSSLSLKYRIALVILLLEAVMMSVVLWQSLGLSAKATAELHRANEDVLLEVVDQIAGTALLTEEYSETQLSIEKLGKQPTVSEILVADIRDRIVISSRVEDIGKPIPKLQSTRQLFWRSSEVASPAGRLGTLAIRFNTTALELAARKALGLGVTIAVIGMGVIAVIGVLVGYALTRRLERVADAAERFAHGEKDARSGVDGSDEIGALGRTFDAMVDQVGSHQSHLEEEVKARTAELREQADIINQTHDSVISTDLEGCVTSWNGGAERLFGIPADQALGRHIAFIYPKDQHAYLQIDVIDPLKSKGRHETEVRMKHRDGSIFPAHLSLSLLYDEDGTPKGIVGYSMDISEQKKREQELAALADRLQASNAELESFSYSVSHDLRAPLRAIDGFSLAVIDDYAERLDDTAVGYLNRVRAGAQRMGELIDDLLQLSRVNRHELQFQDVDLGRIAHAVIDELSAADTNRQVELTVGDGLVVRSDPRLLRVMMDNLLGNAWKFTSRNARAQITFNRSTDDPEVFYVRDDGVGFNMRYADKLFGTFQRLHRDADFPGSGVGLASVQRIVNRLGGRIWADAREGEGATFYFSLSTGNLAS